MRTKYPKSENIVNYNKEILERIKVKKADRHDILSYSRIYETIDKCKIIKGDVYDKGVCLLKGIIIGHPFASGNRRTAFGVTKEFLEDNKSKMNVDNSGKEARTLQGIREGYYTDKEIKGWLKNGKIRRFERENQ